jgi:putative phosphoesterase
MEVLVISDTHLHGGSRRGLPEPVERAAMRVDVVLHAGDVTDVTLLDRLAAWAPVHAVLGNNDTAELARRLPETVLLDLEGVAVAMVHDSGPARGRAGRLHRRFPEADVVVFGHSHVPVDEAGERGQLLFNPGSPTQRRRQPQATYGELVLRDGQVISHRIVPVPA